MKDEIIIKAEHVYKQYRLGAIGGTTLREDLQRLGAKIANKEDPTVKIGQETDGKHKGEKFNALSDVSFEIKKGEAVGIIGGNGAGKSTLLKLISRVTAPTKGMISYNGRITSMLEVGTGFHPELTGRENIYMNGAILGMSKAEINAKIEEIIDFSEVREFIDTPVKRYSSGMYVKLAFSVASHLDSEIMIMDEVLAVGDMAFQKKCLDKMRNAANTQGKTILYVSHNMNTIRQLCDRCIVLDKGRLIFSGDVEEAIAIYQGKNEISSQVVDLSEIKRNQKTSDGLKFRSIEINNSDDWRIKTGDKLRFTLNLTATKDLSDIGFRSRISCQDGKSVSVLLARNLINCKAGEELKIPLEADVSTLVPGTYFLTPALYAVNEYGGWEFYDHIDCAVTFDIDNTLGFNENMPWDVRWWGNVKLPELTDLRK